MHIGATPRPETLAENFTNSTQSNRYHSDTVNSMINKMFTQESSNPAVQPIIGRMDKLSVRQKNILKPYSKQLTDLIKQLRNNRVSYDDIALLFIGKSSLKDLKINEELHNAIIKTDIITEIPSGLFSSKGHYININITNILGDDILKLTCIGGFITENTETTKCKIKVLQCFLIELVNFKNDKLDISNDSHDKKIDPISRHLKTKLENKSDDEIIHFCTIELDAIMILVENQDNQNIVINKLTAYYQDICNMSNADTQNNVNRLLSIFKRTNSWWQQDITGAGARYITVLCKTLNQFIDRLGSDECCVNLNLNTYTPLYAKAKEIYPEYDKDIIVQKKAEKCQLHFNLTSDTKIIINLPLPERIYEEKLDLSDRIITNVRMRVYSNDGISFNKTTLNDCIFCAGDLSGNFDYANFIEATLNNTTFFNVTLNMPNFTKAKLTNILFRVQGTYRYGDLYKPNFTQAILKNVNFISNESIYQGATLKDADFTGATLIDVGFGEYKVINLTFNNTKISGSSLKKVDLNRVDLSTSDLNELDLLGVNFCGTVLDPNQEINISKVFSNRQITGTPDQLDSYFNHIHNRETGSIFTAIDSIDNKYQNLKINLMEQVVNWLKAKNVNITSIIEPLIDILARGGYLYLSNQVIANFVHDRILGTIISNSNETALKPCSQFIKSMLMQFIIELDSDKQEKLMLENNEFFVQFIYQCIEPQDTSISDLAKNLYEKYLKLNDIKPYTFDDYGFGDMDGSTSWSDANAYNYIFKHGDQVIIVSHNYLSMALHEKPNSIMWDSLVYINGEEQPLTGDRLKLDDVFNKFKIFNNRYQYLHKEAKFILMLELLNLKDEQGDYTKLFKDALNSKLTSSSKLIGATEQMRLANMLGRLMTKNNQNDLDIGLTSDHYQDLLKIYGLNSKIQKPTEIARILLCLASVFVQYSSSVCFGEGNYSPQILRIYAYALIKKVHELDKSVIGEQQYQNWVNRLWRLNGEFDCTAILGGMIRSYIKNNFPEIYDAYIPPHI